VAVDTLYTTATDLLAAAVTALACEDRRVPDLTFVSWAPPVWDCELLAVHLDGASFDEVRGVRCAAVPSARFGLTLLRCWPVIEQVDGDIIEAAAAHLLADTWALVRHFAAGWSNGTLVTTASCDGVRLGQVSMLGPAGGLAGVSLTVTVAPQDTDPPCGS